MAAVIAAAKMNCQRHARTPRRMETGVIRANRLLEERIRLDLHFRVNPLAPFLVHEIAVARRIDLNVFNAIARQLREIHLHEPVKQWLEPAGLLFR